MIYAPHALVARSRTETLHVLTLINTPSRTGLGRHRLLLLRRENGVLIECLDNDIQAEQALVEEMGVVPEQHWEYGDRVTTNLRLDFTYSTSDGLSINLIGERVRIQQTLSGYDIKPIESAEAPRAIDVQVLPTKSAQPIQSAPQPAIAPKPTTTLQLSPGGI
jgi:hypothetical protein